MANDVEIRIGAELTEIKGALAQLGQQLQQVNTKANGAGGAKPLSPLTAALGQAKALIGGIIAGFATMAAFRGFVRVADEMTTLNARLKIATQSQDEYRRAQVALFEISQRTRSGLVDTIDLYTKLANATKDANVGQETLLGITETVNKAVQLSGADAGAAQAAITQLGQGLASGTLRGDELNSVLEQTPRLADAIAKGMNITRGELRKYGEQGKITAQEVIRALVTQKEAVDAEFAQLPTTVGQATTKVGNSWRKLIEEFDKTSGSTRGLASVISDLADFISSDETIGAVQEFANIWSTAFADIVADIGRAVDIIRDDTDDMTGDGRDAIDILIDAFKELPVNIRTIARIIGVTLGGMVDSFIADARFAKEALAAIFTDDTIEAALERRNRTVNNAAQTTKEMVDEILADRQRELDAAKAARAAAQREREAARKLRGGTGTGTPGKPTADKNAATAADFADAEAKLVKDATERQIRAIEQLYEDAGISAADYIRQRTALQLQAIDAEIAAERERAKAGGKEALKANTEIELLNRQRAQIEQDAQRELTRINRDAERERIDLRAELLQQEGNEVEAARLRVEAKYADTLARLQAEGDTAGVELVRKIINNEVLAVELQTAEQQVQTTLDRLSAGEERLRTAAELGVISQTTAEQQTQELRERSIELLRQQIAELEALAAASTDPKIIAKIEEYKGRLAELEAQQTPLLQKTKNIGENALGTFLNDLATNAKTAGEAVKDLVRNFVSGLARMAAEALAKRWIFDLFGGSGGGGGGGGGGLLGSMLSFLFHTGGIVGAGGTGRMVNPLIFAGAPRFHSGGMAGLAPNEVPAILQKGEEVLTADDPRHAQNGGGAGYRILNVIDPNLVADYLDSAAGERTVMNIISRNGGQVQQIIGS